MTRKAPFSRQVGTFSQKMFWVCPVCGKTRYVWVTTHKDGSVTNLPKKMCTPCYMMDKFTRP